MPYRLRQSHEPRAGGRRVVAPAVAAVLEGCVRQPCRTAPISATPVGSALSGLHPVLRVLRRRYRQRRRRPASNRVDRADREASHAAGEGLTQVESASIRRQQGPTPATRSPINSTHIEKIELIAVEIA